MPVKIRESASLDGWEVQEKNLLSKHPSFKEWNKKTEAVVERMLDAHPSLERRPYQWESAALYCMRRNNLMAHAQGAGKTTTTGITIAALYPEIRKGTARPGLVQIVAPSVLSAQTRWLQDLERLPDLQGKIALVNNPKTFPTAPIWVYTCDFLRRQSPLIRNRTQARRRMVCRNIRPAALLVVDEVHLFKQGSLRMLSLKYFSDRCRRILALTGTLSDGRLELVHDICDLVYRTWPFQRREFLSQFAQKQAVNSRYVESDTEELRPSTRYLESMSVFRVPDYYSIARQHIHRLTLNDPSVAACIKRPQEKSQIFCVSPSQDQRELYLDIVQQHLEQIQTLAGLDRGGMPTKFKLLWKLFEAANTPWQHGVLAPKKAEKLLELVHSSPKTVVFTSSVSAGRWLHRFLSNNFGRDQVVRLYAQDPEANPARMGDAERETALARHCFEPTVKVGIFSLRLACLSIDMLSTEQVIFWDLPWECLLVQQAITRVVRPGNSNKTVRVQFLTTDGMLDHHAFILLGQKLRNARMLLDYELDTLQEADIGSVDAADLARAILGGSS